MLILNKVDLRAKEISIDKGIQGHYIKEKRVEYLGHEDPMDEGMATHLNILSWRIPMDKEPGRLYSPWGHD